jgi:dihydropteroate synthase
VKIRKFKALGMEQLIADPGFGFGKTIDNNYDLLRNLDVFKILEIPILAGISRKSMLYKLLEITPDQSLNATTAMHAIALQNGVKILRVHDVKEAVEVVKLMEKIVK